MRITVNDHEGIALIDSGATLNLITVMLPREGANRDPNPCRRGLGRTIRWEAAVPLRENAVSHLIWRALATPRDSSVGGPSEGPRRHPRHGMA